VRLYPSLTVDGEFKALRDAGYTGSLNDMQFAFLRSEGYSGALGDMQYQFTGGDAPPSGVYYPPATTILSSFSTPGPSPIGLAFDGNNLISCDFNTDRIYIHDGVSSTVSSNFASPGAFPYGLTFDGTNLISCDGVAARIYVHSGVSSTTLSNFATPGTFPTGLAFDGTNLISCDASSDTIYVHSGISSTISSSFASPGGGSSLGLTFDGTNLISCDNSAEIIYIHDGVSSTILDSFSSPSGNPSGLTFNGTNLISCDTSSDTIYVHGTGPSQFDLTAVENPLNTTLVGYDTRGTPFGQISQEPFDGYEISVLLYVGSSNSVDLRFKGNVVDDLAPTTKIKVDGTQYNLTNWGYQSSSDETTCNVSTTSLSFVDGQTYEVELF